MDSMDAYVLSYYDTVLALFLQIEWLFFSMLCLVTGNRYRHEPSKINL